MDATEERASGAKITAGKKDEAIEGEISGAAIFLGILFPFEREIDIGKKEESIDGPK